MVIRFDTSCPICGKKESCFGHEQKCHECSLTSFMKAQLRAAEKDKAFRKEVKEMEPELRKKIHDNLLKELMEESHE